jgi:hypothetical protein
MYEAERRDHNISVAIYTVLIVSLCIVVLLMSLGGAVAQ